MKHDEDNIYEIRPGGDIEKKSPVILKGKEKK